MKSETFKKSQMSEPTDVPSGCVVEVCEEPLDTDKETFSLCKQTQSRYLELTMIPFISNKK